MKSKEIYMKIGHILLFSYELWKIFSAWDGSEAVGSARCGLRRDYVKGIKQKN